MPTLERVRAREARRERSLAAPTPSRPSPAAAAQRALATPTGALRVADVLALQGALGNRAVQRLLASAPAPAPTGAAGALVIQRKKLKDETLQEIVAKVGEFLEGQKKKPPIQRAMTEAKRLLGNKEYDKEDETNLRAAIEERYYAKAKKTVVVEKEEVKFASNLLPHIFDGEAKGDAHTGYHSTARKGPETTPEKVALASQEDADGNGVYRGSFRLYFGKKLGQAKSSSMFPDAWGEQKVTDEIRHAYQHQQPHGGEVGWAGLATDGQTKIGGRRSSGAITTAYPAYNDVFTE